MGLSVSIVINTYNRAASLVNTLESLPLQNYSNFEVIVVNGPSTDNTEEILACHAGRIKAGRCPEANLSVSRNIGIGMAAGEIVAFIDDDAIPEPEWLERIVQGYASDEIGGVGGFVYDHTGAEFQSKYILCNRIGDARFNLQINPTPAFNFPYTHEYCSLMGTNATYRRSALLEIGGFDEYFAYYLDETDVCLRIVDRGYQIVFHDWAFVHHKFAPSHLRDTRRVLKDRTQIARSKGYFAMRNSRDTHSYQETFEGLQAWLEMVRNGILWETEHGLITEKDKEMFFQQLNTGLEEGMRAAVAGPRVLLTAKRAAQLQQPFLPFPVKQPQPRKLVICLLSQDYPPGIYGGIGKWTHELAIGIAAEGHTVHVLTRGAEHNRVDLEQGVWVHRIVPVRKDHYRLPSFIDLPQNIVDYTCTMHEEVRRIKTTQEIDIVVCPIWDHQGIACLLDPELPAVMTLQTTFQLMLDSHPEWLNDPNHKLNYIDKMIRAEHYLLQHVPFIQSNTAAMIESIRQAYGIVIDPQRYGVTLLGVEDLAQQYHSQRQDHQLEILFVGRLEKRKGIDLLLRCIPGLCRQFKNIRFVIVGEDHLKNENNRTFKEEFLGQYAELERTGRVVFKGRVSDDELFQHYADCDIFVSPSVFESFGLIFTEAMAFGKPVIGSRAGGMVEVIADGENGFLIEPGNWLSLYEALRVLIEDESKREAFGVQSRAIFERCFTRQCMVQQAIDYYHEVLRRKKALVEEQTNGAAGSNWPQLEQRAVIG